MHAVVIEIVNSSDDDVVNRIVQILKEYNNGLTITDLVELSQLSRSAIRTALAKLEGGKKISFRKVGMAKLYYCIGK